MLILEALQKIDQISKLAEADKSADASGAGIDKYKPNDGIPVISASSLSKAQEIALKQLGPGKKFRWCNTYKVDGKKRDNRQQPAAMPTPSPWVQAGGAEVAK